MATGSLEDINKGNNASPSGLSEILDFLERTADVRLALSSVVQYLGASFGSSQALALTDSDCIDRVLLSWEALPSNDLADASLSVIARFAARHAKVSPRTLVQTNPLHDIRWSAIAEELQDCNASYVLARTIRYVGMPLVTFVLLRGPESQIWSEQDIEQFDDHCRSLAPTLYRILIARKADNEAAVEQAAVAEATVAQAGVESADSQPERYRRLVEYGDVLIFQMNPAHEISYINQRAIDFFGVKPTDFLGSTPVSWYELAHLDDRERLRQRAREMSRIPQSVEEEFRIINHLSGVERWLHAKFTPVRDATGRLTGWDGFGIDITRRQEAQTALDGQNKKIRALYTVASAIRGFFDPTSIASRGLDALCEATGAQAGVCYLYARPDQGEPELVAQHGFSESVAQKLGKAATMPRLPAHVAEHGQPIVVSDIRTDPRASRLLAEEEGIRSAVLVPISVEESVFGVIGLFHREVGVFGSGDVMLVSAAGNQIGLAARQAYLFSAYRRQTKNLAALYRLSHELSGSSALDEIFQKAFTIIREELGVKRLWLGLLNETNTRIIGQAAYGPGWKRRLVEINVEVAGRDHPIAEVVTTRKPLIIDDPEKVLKEFGVRRFFSRFSINAVGLIPLISAGQVLGVLAFQPSADAPEIEEEEVTLIASLASEIASTILTKRLDERVGEADKMRAAGLLAAGIAHNFNNLLQAILGQASLLEMQQVQASQVARAAQIINDAAAKGATLVKQLMSFANLEEPSKEISDANTIVERGKKSLARYLKPHQSIQLDLATELPRAHADPGQVMRILTSLVTNASEASEEGDEIEIFTADITVDRNSPHFEVPFGEYITIGVRDHGIGMDEESKRRCFEPFFTTKNVDPASGLSMSGAGLGLASAFALARKNGGRLVVDSRRGHGSVFTLYLPVAPVSREKSSATEEGQSLSQQIEIHNNDRESVERVIERITEVPISDRDK